MSARRHGAAPARPGDLWRTLAGLAVVLGSTAALLAAADAVPAWIAGEPRDVRRVSGIQEAEKRLRARLVLPAYFPDRIAFPPRVVRVKAGPEAGALLEFDDRQGQPRLVLVQPTHGEEIPEALLPAGRSLDPSPATVASVGGELRRVVGPDGEVWHELRWRYRGRRLLLRTRGGVDEAVRMAKSMREEQ